MKFESNLYPIIKSEIGGQSAYFLLDSGASIGLLDSRQLSKYNLIASDLDINNILGLDESVKNVKRCETIITIFEKQLSNFMVVNLENICNSIERLTGILILGLISYPLMLFLGITLKLNN